MNEFMEYTNNEIENIKKIVELNYKWQKNEQEDIKKLKEETNTIIQNIITFQKEIAQRVDIVGIRIEDKQKDKANPKMRYLNNSEYAKYKDNIKSSTNY